MVPKAWQSELRQPPNNLPPTIVFSSKTEPEFQVLFTIIFSPEKSMKTPDISKIKNDTQNLLSVIQSQAVESKIELQELKGKAISGYYFSATDRAPKPGEFKYITQGTLLIDNLFPVFTILTNDDSVKIIASALEMLKSSDVVSENDNALQCGKQNGTYYSVDFGRNEAVHYIEKSFGAGNFKALIDTAEVWKTKNCLLNDGETRIGFWLSGFTKYFDKNKDWGKSLEQIERFKNTYPKSVLPLLAEARYWSDYAYDARGSGYASTVSEDAWKLFRERMIKSETILFNTRTEASNWPMWYWQIIRVESLLGRDLEEKNKLFLEGTQKFRNEIAIYTEMSNYLEPRWGGSWSEVDRIASYADKTVQSEPPDATYTRMYWATGSMMQSQEDFFSKTQVSWPKMRAGFISLLKIYPKSTSIGNSLLKYSCLAKDKETYLEYRKTITLLDPGSWRADLTRDHCDVFFNFVK